MNKELKMLNYKGISCTYAKKEKIIEGYLYHVNFFKKFNDDILNINQYIIDRFLIEDIIIDIDVAIDEDKNINIITYNNIDTIIKNIIEAY